MSWNRSSGAAKPETKKPSAMRGVIAGGVIVLAACAAFFFLFSGGDEPAPARSTKHEARGTIKEVTPAKVAGDATDDAVEPKRKTAAEVAREYSEQVKEFVKKSPGTNKVSWIEPPLDPDDPDRALHTRVACELSSLLSVEPGDRMPPFPYSFLLEGEGKSKGDGGNAAFLESLKKFKIAAKETDSEKRLDHKQKLIEAQAEILSGIVEGISVNDSIRAAYEFRQRAYEMRSTIINTLAELHQKDGNDEDTIRQVNDMNKRLAEEGIKQIPIVAVIPDYEEPEEEVK